MQSSILPDFFTRFYNEALTPAFWQKIIGIVFAAILILAFFRILQTIVNKTLRKTMPEPKAQLIRKIIRYTGYVVAVASILQSMGINLSALLGAAGIAGIAIGFAAQTSVSNLISGLFLISERSFQIGDVIKTGDITGIVMSIDLLSVKLQTFDNKFVRIPNESIIKTNVINITRFPIQRLDITVGVSYNSDLKKVIAVLKDIAAKNKYVLDNPEPLILIDKIDASSINILFGVWFEQSKLIELKNSIIIEIQECFAKEGIEIPHSKMDIYIKEKL